jgi:hypothetical protein
MAHGNTYVFLFHDVSNFRTPFLRLLVNKGHFQVFMEVPVLVVAEAFRDSVRHSKEVLLP